MFLPVTTFSTAKSVINLSKADLLLALEEGKRATWAKLPAIQVCRNVFLPLEGVDFVDVCCC